MANLDYLSQIMPFSWHEARRKHEQGDNPSSVQFDENKVSGGLGEMEVVAWISALTKNDHIVFNNVLTHHLFC